MADVRLENAVKKFGDKKALNKLSFECKEGEFFTLLGPSGAGKTTTLDVIAGLKKLDSGNVYMGGECVDDLPTQERDVAMAFENYALYSHLTNYDNIAFPLRSPKRTVKLSKQEEKQAVENIATRLGIEEHLHKMPRQLSGGQKQRVSLARAMVRRPKVFLLDEPIAHLDAKLKAQARSDLKKIASEFGTTIIYVTHNYREALALSDRIMIMRSGKAEQIDTPEEIYQNPASDFVANLVGDPPVNLLDGELTEENGSTFFNGQGFRFRLSDEQAKQVEDKSWIEDSKRMTRLSVRPEHVHIAAEKQSEVSAKMPIFVLERKDESYLVKFSIQSGLFIADAGKNVSFKENDEVFIHLDLDNAHFFRKTIELG